MRITLRRTMIASASVTALLLVMTATAPAAPAPVPFIETFDGRTLGNIHGLGPWTTNGSEDASAVVQSTNYIAGTQGASTDMADLTLSVDGSAENVWCQLYAKPTLHANDAAVADPTADVSAAFYVQSNGAVKAWSGLVGDWVTVGTVSNDNRWLAFAVHSDYASETWNLYVSDDGAYGTAYRRLNGETPLEFNSTFVPESGLGLTNVTIGGVATIDAVALGKGVRLPADTGSNVVVSATSLTGGEQALIGLQTHGYAAGENSLGTGKLLRNDMAVWLDVPDSVIVRRGLVDWTYVRSGPGFSEGANIPIVAGSGVWVTKSVAGNLVMFMDYNTLSAPAAVPVYDTVVNGSFTLLAWDQPSLSPTLGSTDLGFSGLAVVGDFLFVFSDGLKALRWNGTAWSYKNQPAPQQLHPGDGFWYYSNAGEDSTWVMPPQ